MQRVLGHHNNVQPIVDQLLDHYPVLSSIATNQHGFESKYAERLEAVINQAKDGNRELAQLLERSKKVADQVDEAALLLPNKNPKESAEALSIYEAMQVKRDVRGLWGRIFQTFPSPSASVEPAHHSRRHSGASSTHSRNPRRREIPLTPRK